MSLSQRQDDSDWFGVDGMTKSMPEMWMKMKVANCRVYNVDVVEL